MSMPGKPSHYRAYLLRFWEERRERFDLSGVWRFSLEDPHSGQRHGFASLEELARFLEQEMNRDKRKEGNENEMV